MSKEAQPRQERYTLNRIIRVGAGILGIAFGAHLLGNIFHKH